MEFAYTAIAKDGHKESATIEAPNALSAGHMLKEQGLLPVKLTELDKGSVMDIMKKVSTISLAEKIGFFENLTVMLKAGISISRCLQILVKQTKNYRFQTILNEVYSQVQQGKSLADALSKYEDVFPSIAISMIRVGELSGGLDKSLAYLSDQLQREADLKSKVKGAMMYPGVIMSAMVIIGVLMSIFVLPSLTSVFKDFSNSLPPTTKAVIAFADFMHGHAVLVIAAMVGMFIGLFAFLKTYAGKRAFNYLSLHFYIINTIVKKINLARFARVLSSLIKSGIPIVQALDVAGESLNNILYKELIRQAAVDVKLGKPLADSLGKDNSLFPVIVVQMIQVGEESGTVQEILEQLAIHYEVQVDDTLKNLSSIIEPLLLLVIGAVVGLLAVSLISPIYNISQTIQ